MKVGMVGKTPYKETSFKTFITPSWRIILTKLVIDLKPYASEIQLIRSLISITIEFYR